MAVKVFIWAVLGIALLLCVLAAVFGVGETGDILYRIGSVIALAAVVAALTERLLADLLNGNDNG